MTLARPAEVSVLVTTNAGPLVGDLVLPDEPRGVVAFAHGSGSSRHSSRNRHVADVLVRHGLAALLVDLLTPGEGLRDELDAALRFDIKLIGARTVMVVDELVRHPATHLLPIGLFGASTGAAAALVAAARRPRIVRAVVSRGGRPDLAQDALPGVRAATLLIVGGNDEAVLDLNRAALGRMRMLDRDLVVVPGATHLFEEPGALDRVAELASAWFVEHLGSRQREWPI